MSKTQKTLCPLRCVQQHNPGCYQSNLAYIAFYVTRSQHKELWHNQT